jgi:hypothetical protein
MDIAEIIPPAPIGQSEPWEALEPGEYAIVEIMGHSTLIGRIDEVDRFGTKMMAITPLFNGHVLPTVFQSGASIYRLTPCSPQVAWERQPKQPYQLPDAVRATLPPMMLPAPASPVERYARGDDDQDDDEPEF